MIPTLSDFRPRLDSPSSVRRFLAVAAIFSTALLIYASFVPLRFRPLSWQETLQAWRNIPWLSLDVFHRADWVANALVVLPAGVLAAAAVDWGRHSTWQLVLATPLIAFGLALVVIGIELAQVWFPPRTVSLNDIAAGFVGAALGPMLWAVGGTLAERTITGFLTLPHFRDRLAWLCVVWFVGAAIYSILPLDVVLSSAEWRDRIESGRISLVPFTGAGGLTSKLFDASLAAVRMAPLGVYFFLRSNRRVSFYALWLLPIALELIQLPVYSKFVTGTAVVGGWCGGWCGYYLASKLDRLAWIARQPVIWGVCWLLTVLVAVVALLSGAQQFVDDPLQVQQRYELAWTAPLVKYYAGSEYSAYTVMLEKMALFGAIGVACAGWTNSVSSRTGRWIHWASLLLIAAVAVGIEWMQVYLLPFVPDFSDAFVYMSGYAAGYVGMKVLWGPTDS